jgi:carbonic anhydrase
MHNYVRYSFYVLLSIAGGLLAPGVVSASDENRTLTREAQAKITPAMALEKLRRGNQRFVSGEMTNQNYVAQMKQTSTGQFPFASIASCLDSRIPPALIFNRGIGDLFVARVAVNFVNDDVLGSLEFAAKVAGSKMILVMGHNECGAVKGACDGVQLGLLTATLANINPAVEAVKGSYSPANSKNADFVQAVAEMNVQLTMQKLRD